MSSRSAIVTGRILRVERPFKCDVCCKRFRTNGYMTRHIEMVHLVTRSFKCNECDLAFEKKSKMKQHVRLVHLGTIEEPYRQGPSPKFECSKCGKTVTNLNRHITLIHNRGELEHECKVCNKLFAYKGTLARHSKIHSCSLEEDKGYTFQESEVIESDEDTVSCSSIAAELTEPKSEMATVKLEEMFDWDQGNGDDGNSY